MPLSVRLFGVSLQLTIFENSFSRTEIHVPNRCDGLMNDQGRGQHLQSLKSDQNSIPKLERAMRRFLRGSNASNHFMPQSLLNTNGKPKANAATEEGKGGEGEEGKIGIVGSGEDDDDDDDDESIEFAGGLPVERLSLPVRHTVTLGADQKVTKPSLSSCVRPIALFSSLGRLPSTFVHLMCPSSLHFLSQESRNNSPRTSFSCRSSSRVNIRASLSPIHCSLFTFLLKKKISWFRTMRILGTRCRETWR